MQKYSKRFMEDVRWYLSVRHVFNFSGKAPQPFAVSRSGVTGVAAFFRFDSTGQRVATRHPRIAERLLLVKSSVNLHVKMWAEDYALGIFNSYDIAQLEADYKSPPWLTDAIKKQAARNDSFPQMIARQSARHINRADI